MPTQSREWKLYYPRLKFRISFFQDFFTIIEEITNNGPGVGLPSGFFIDKDIVEKFNNIKYPKEFCLSYIKKDEKLKNFEEYKLLSKIKTKYFIYWLKNLPKLIIALHKLKNKSYKDLQKVQEVTKFDWKQKEIPVYFVVGYKDSGTYDRDVDLIRLGMHQNKEYFTYYTLIHELIHFFIVKNMDLKLKEPTEERLCRAIFNKVFENDKLGQEHWRVYLSEKEIKKIKELNINDTAHLV